MALLCLNAIGVTFTGMEHSLHILATVAAGLGLILTDEEHVPRWLPYVLIGQILIRFEGGAILAAALVVLIYYRHWSAAAIAAFGAAVAIGIYTGTMVSAGLPLLPSSVAIKSAIAEAAIDHGSLQTIAARLSANFLSNLGEPAAIALHLFALTALWCAVWTPQRLRGQPRIFLIAILVAILAHDIAGDYGWFSRYELYVLFFSLVMGAYVFAPYLRAGILRASRWSVVTAVAGALVLSFFQGPAFLVLTVRGANNVHEQQYQLHRFAADFYKNPVAVNDLGYVSYGNDAFVLDLVGLGSERARLARRGGGTDWMARIVDDYRIGLALIYEDWFPGMIPAKWRKVAELRLSRPGDSASRDTVAFFVTRAQDCTDVVDKVHAFRPTLPAGVTPRRSKRRAGASRRRLRPAPPDKSGTSLSTGRLPAICDDRPSRMPTCARSG